MIIQVYIGSFIVYVISIFSNPRLVLADPYTPELKDEQRKRWINENAFITQITQTADIFYEPPLGQGPAVENIRRGRTYDKEFGLGPGCPSFKERGWGGYEQDRWVVWGGGWGWADKRVD